MARIGRSLTFVAVALLAGCDAPPAIQGPQYVDQPGEALAIYRFAIHPLHNPQALVGAYQPLIDHLEREIPDVRFELEASRDYAEYEKKFRSRAPELLLPNPWQTLEAMKVGYTVIAMAGEPEDFKGIFVVRRDSDIAEVSDLKGKTVAYPSPTALAATMMPQWFLHQHGIDVVHEIDNHYVGSQESAIMNAFLGQAAAGATWPPPWRLFAKSHPDEAAQLRVIWETPPLINNSVMARDNVPDRVRSRVRETLLALHQRDDGRAILALMETARFLPAADVTYAPVRRFIERFEAEVRSVESP